MIMDKSKTPSKKQLINLLEYYQNGRYTEAENLAVLLTQDFPSINLPGKF